MPIDIRTVMAILPLIYALCTLLLTILWRQNRMRFEGMHLFVLTFTFQAIGTLMIAGRGVVPLWLSVIVGNMLLLCGALAGYIGLLMFCKEEKRQIHNYLLLALAGAGFYYFVYIQPDFAVRTLIFSVALLVISLQGFYLLFFPGDRKIWMITHTVGVAFLGYCLVSLANIIAFFLQKGIGADLFDAQIFATTIMISYLLLSILLTYTLSLMINKRLLLEIQAEEDKFSKAFHTSPYGIVIARLPGGAIVEVNDVFLEMTGYTREEIIGKSNYDLNIWYDDDACSAVVSEMMKSGHVRGQEMVFRKKNGEVFCGLASSEMLVINQAHCTLSSIIDITERKQHQFEREALIEQLQQALAEVKVLSGMLPMCSSCKKIRDDKGYWNSLEAYIHKHSTAKLTHGICPDCRRKLYPEYAGEKKG